MRRVNNRQIRVFVMLASAMACTLAGRFAAGTVTYYGRDANIGAGDPNSLAAQNNFFANLLTSGTDNLDSYVPAAGPDPTNAPNLSFGGTGITATEAFAGVQQSGSIGLSISPLNTLLAVPALAPDTMTFSSPVKGFGAYFLNAGDDATTPDTVSLQLVNTATMQTRIVPIDTFGPGESNFNGFYFGLVTADPFDQVTLLQSNPGDGILLDNITVGSAVPEPSSLVLLLVGGAAGLGLIIRKRGRAAAK